MRVPHLAIATALATLVACAGGGGGSGSGEGGGGLVCVAGAACTPSVACSKGELRCDPGGPTCVATTTLPDGTTCGDGATCAGGTCQRTITITAADRYHDDAGAVVTVPRAALGESTFRVLFLGPDGAYQVFPGSVVARGVVEIPGVPVGTSLVERTDPWSTAPSFTELSGNVLDDSYDLAGRPDAARSTLPTRVELLASGLAPWQVSVYPEDRLQVVSSNFGLALDLWAPGIPAGATEASVVPWPGTTAGTPLLDGAAGDRVQVVQLGRKDGPVPYLTPVRSGTLPATFQVVDGVAQVAPVVLDPVARTGTLAADWAVGEMEALLGAMGPSPEPYPLHVLTVTSWPHGFAPAGGTLLEMMTASTGNTLSIGPLDYGRPYPDFFVELGEARMTADVQLLLPDPSAPAFSETVSASTSFGSPAAGRLSVRPAVSPPRGVRVAGLDVGRTPRFGVGATPTMSWSAPSLGKADLYRVTIRKVVTTSFSRTVARFTLASTEIQVPPGLLQAGASYYARLTAYSTDGYAETVTAGFTP